MDGHIDEERARYFRAQFPTFDRVRYLNSCSLGPLSRASRQGLEQYAEHWETYGAPAWWLEWMPRIEHIKQLFARLVGASDRSVTIHHSISSALSTIASCIDHTHRPKVVVSELDFPTIAYQWLARRDVEVTFARTEDGITVPISEYERLIDERTALVATSHVFYATGARQDVKAIATIAHQKGAVAVVDGYHAAGVIPVDVKSLQADFYLSGTLKWLCGGPGLAFVYADEEQLADLAPGATGWFAARDQFAFDTMDFQRAESADRLQMGTPSIPTLYSGIPALELILDAGADSIAHRVASLVSRATEGAWSRGFEVTTPNQASQRAGIVMIRAEEPQRAADYLAQHSVVADARLGRVRLSPHFFNTEEDIDVSLAALEEYGGVVAV
ncbi:MAG TPA: aminotransferase class V-fold PLP-dependent enzyme [Chloroflexota bacterium]|nr:aminotransferase class V-fold PLP-dependent enzyme [Chloroflexota bacterium]